MRIANINALRRRHPLRGPRPSHMTSQDAGRPRSPRSRCHSRLGRLRGPATTEIDSPSLRGRRRLNRRVKLILSQESFH
jgi:hypothetical protein